MTDRTDRTIERLVAEMQPVRRLRPPLMRAALWLLAVAVVAGVGILGFAGLDLFRAQTDTPEEILGTIAILATGLAGVVAAFHLSLPDRSAAWAWLPLPPLAVWIGSTGYSCYRNWIAVGADGWSLGESAECFGFIVGVSVPLGISLLWLLHRARPLAPAGVAAVAGLGVAGLAAFLLQFIHGFDVTFLDLAVHAVAVGIVIAVSTVSSRSAA